MVDLLAEDPNAGGVDLLSREPDYNRLNPSLPGYTPPAPYQTKELTVDYSPETWKAAKKSNEEQQQIMAILQEKYGDESTIERGEYKRKLGPMKGVYKGTYKYDQEELLKRYSKDKWGTDVPPSKNPFVHLGHTIDNLKVGTKQAMGILDESDWQDYQNREMAYQAGDQPKWAQIAGDALPGLPFMGINTTMKAAAGQAIKKTLSKRVGENLLRDAAFTGAGGRRRQGPDDRTGDCC